MSPELPESSSPQPEPSSSGGEPEILKEPDIQKGDPVLRRKMLIVLGILCLVCVLGVLSLDSYLGHLQEVARTISLEEAAEKTHRVARVVLGAVSLGAVGMALYLALLAARILKHRRFPPPDTRVISDTRVLSGLHARVYGWVSLLLAVLLLVMGVLLPLRAEQILERQLDPRLRPIPQNNQDLGLGPW